MVMNIFTRAPRNPKNIYRTAKYFIARIFGSENYAPFLVISRSRTGSTLLMTSLNSHSNIICRGERLNFLRRNETSRKRNPVAVIKNIYGKQPTYIKAAGFKLFYSCLLYTSPSPRDATLSRMPSSA